MNIQHIPSTSSPVTPPLSHHKAIGSSNRVYLDREFYVDVGVLDETTNAGRMAEDLDDVQKQINGVDTPTRKWQDSQMELEFNWRAEEMTAIDVQGDVGLSRAKVFRPRDHAHLNDYSFVTPSSPHSDAPNCAERPSTSGRVSTT